jgi:hypothetical protein
MVCKISLGIFSPKSHGMMNWQLTNPKWFFIQESYVISSRGSKYQAPFGRKSWYVIWLRVWHRFRWCNKKKYKMFAQTCAKPCLQITNYGWPNRTSVFWNLQFLFVWNISQTSLISVILGRMLFKNQ